jgi:hypothetical protein
MTPRTVSIIEESEASVERKMVVGQEIYLETLERFDRTVNSFIRQTLDIQRSGTNALSGLRNWSEMLD